MDGVKLNSNKFLHVVKHNWRKINKKTKQDYKKDTSILTPFFNYFNF